MSTTRKRAGQPRLHICPQHGGAFTRWRLTGSLVTVIPSRDLRSLFGKLALWSGSPTELVLPAAGGMDVWRDFWATAVDHVPAHHLEIRFEFPKHPFGHG